MTDLVSIHRVEAHLDKIRELTYHLFQTAHETQDIAETIEDDYTRGHTRGRADGYIAAAKMVQLQIDKSLRMLREEVHD